MKKSLAVVSLAAIVCLSGCSFGVVDPSNDSAPGKNAGQDAGQGAGQDAGATTGDSASALSSGPCDGRDLVVDEEGSNLVLTGECGTLTITASEVSVNVDDATKLVVSGSNVSVIASRLGEVEISGDYVTVNPDVVASILLSGDYNTLVAQEANDISISGDFNIANWSEGATTANDTGDDNTVVAP